jgi:hypothetical protein
MNLWIASRATHLTDTEIVHVYCVMYCAFVVSDWYDTKAEAQSALDEIVGRLEFAE